GTCQVGVQGDEGPSQEGFDREEDCGEGNQVRQEALTGGRPMSPVKKAASSAKKSTARKSTAKKSTARKSPAKKTTAARKTTAKRSTARKTTAARKSTAKRS